MGGYIRSGFLNNQNQDAKKKKKKRNAPFPGLPLPICMDYIPIFPLTNYMRKVSQHFILHPLPDRHIKPHA